MADPLIKRKILFYFILAGIISALLLVLFLVEETTRSYLVSYFSLVVGEGGRLSAPTDGSPRSEMAVTIIRLFFSIYQLIKILLWMGLVVAIVRAIGYALFATTLREPGHTEIASLGKTVLSIVIYIVAFFVIFQSQYPNVDLGALFTGSTIIGIVVGLALQDTLGNLFAGLAMQADQPFQVGDVVEISNRGIGIVETVSWRGIKIRTFQNKLLVMSNAVLGKETIEVAPRENLNARLVFFNTLYSNSPSRTALAVREAVRQVENVSQKRRPIVRIRNLADNGIDWEVKYWCEDYARHNESDALIRQRIWYVFRREGIDFAYPTRTVHIEPKREEADQVEYINIASEQIVKVPIFEPLSEDEVERLAKIVRRGQEGTSMFVIVRGSVKVQVPAQDGQKTVNQLYANDFFGEMSLLTGEPRSATVITEEETEVLEIGKPALKPIFEANPGLVESIGNLIEERRELLGPENAAVDSESARPHKSVMRSLKNFFGLK
jgi:small-conductance mechanosensitive channel